MAWQGGRDYDCPHPEVIYPLEQCCPCGAVRVPDPTPIAQIPGQLSLEGNQ